VPDEDLLMAPPPEARVFVRQRRVRLGDATPRGRLRLDALARYLQDVSNDDTRDAGFTDNDEMGWVVRRTVIEVARFPVFGEELTLGTWCSGTGSRWAERRVQVRGDRAGVVEAASTWVHVDTVTGRPKALTPRFHEVFTPSAAGRVVRARLHHGDRPAAADRRSWPLRAADFDVLGHVNNAAYWEAVEEELARRRELRAPLRAPLRAEVEFRAGIDPGMAIALWTVDTESTWAGWLAGEDGVVRASASVTALAHPPA
jgi:acyl-ACP thioesterase